MFKACIPPGTASVLGNFRKGSQKHEMHMANADQTLVYPMRTIFHWLVAWSVKGIRSTKTQCQKWDLNPRPHSWTRTLIDLHYRQGRNLESGALDHSAILTVNKLCM